MYTKSDYIIHLIIQRRNKVSQLFAKLSMNNVLNENPEITITISAISGNAYSLTVVNFLHTSLPMRRQTR